jgi:hypothetical protein
MGKRIPTQAGDVLVLRTAKSYTIHVVGRISNDGQQGVEDQSDLKYEKDRGAPLATRADRARRFLRPLAAVSNWKRVPLLLSPLFPSLVVARSLTGTLSVCETDSLYGIEPTIALGAAVG